MSRSNDHIYLIYNFINGARLGDCLIKRNNMHFIVSIWTNDNDQNKTKNACIEPKNKQFISIETKQLKIKYVKSQGLNE